MSNKYKTLYLFVEGSDDARLFKSIIKPKFDPHYECVRVQEYARRKKDFIEKLIEGIKDNNDQFIFFHDCDSNICILTKKSEIITNVPTLNNSDILIIRKKSRVGIWRAWMKPHLMIWKLPT